MDKKKNTKKITKRIPKNEDEIEKTKRYKIKALKNPKVKKIVKITLLTILFIAIVFAGIVIGTLYGTFREAKLDMKDVAIKYENSVVKDINGNTIAVLSGTENRENIGISDMSKYLPKAFVAIEDERFYDHKGVDIKRTASATAKYILSKVGIGSSDYGGSTITQQLVKNLTKEDERSWKRKVKEMARAHYLEKELSKSQILELYLNLTFLGGRAYGVQVASNYYFSKSASDLSLAESAFLAGINNGPNYYHPFSTEQDDIDRIKRKTKIVLEKMYEISQDDPNHQVAITKEEYETAMQEVENGLAFNQGTIIQTVYSYHTDATILQVKNDLKEKNDWTEEYADYYVKSGGITIYSTQNTDIQKTMEEEVKKDKYVVTAKDNEGNTVTAQTAMVVLDHKTGNVLATVGGIGEKNTAFGLNRATQSYRQPGSSMKPIAVLCPGIDNGTITAGTVYDDIPYSSGKFSGFKNYGYAYKGLITVRYAIATSQNIPMLKAMNDIGVDKSAEYLKSVGINVSDNQKVLSMALGSVEASPLQMAAAYGAIANDGVYIEPTFYTKVTDSEGNVILKAEQESRTVISKASAYVIKEILTEVVRSGAGGYASIPGISVGVKTGTSNDDKDRWFCGFTPYYTAATWFGFDDPRYVSYNGNPSGKIWDGVMEPIHKDLPNAKFSDTKPNEITTATICKCSGKLATEECKNDPRGNQVYTEYFIKGTAPKESCTCHVSVEICKDSGLLAGEYCPAESRETKVFITRPEGETGNWNKAADKDYMLTLKDYCTTHLQPVEQPKPEEPKVVEEPVIQEEQPKPSTNEVSGEQTNTSSSSQTQTNETVSNSATNNTASINNTVVNNTGGNNN